MNIVECRQLNVTLGQTPILHDVNLTLRTGEVLALLGANGSGKTTLLRALLGLVPRTSGEIAILGTPLDRLRDWRSIGYVPQRAELHVTNATVREIAETGRLARRPWFRPLTSNDKQRIELALQQVGMADQAKTPISILSGGQRQRTLIARALAGEPQGILLDEPLAGLDIATQRGLSEVLDRLKTSGTALLVVLHELGPLKKLIDRVIVMRAGRVVHDGPLDEGILNGLAPMPLEK